MTADGQATVDGRRVMVAGTAAAAAYLAAMAADMRLLRYPQNDLVLLGRMLPVFGRFWPVAGLAAHISFSLVMGWFYAAVAGPRLPGPPWLRGVLLAVVENTLLWPLVILIDRAHPAVRDGQMPPLNTVRCFTQATSRHIAFGAALGAVHGPPGVRRRSA